jgi:N-acetyl-anhydromuramyl-L-alanine amidase AmpD
MINIKKILEPVDYIKLNDVSRIKYIVIHFFGDLGSAINVAEYFKNNRTSSSAHYNVDEGDTIYQSVEDGDIAWHCGGAVYFHPKCRNANSVGIEVRPTKINKKTGNDYDKDWYFLEQTIVNTLQLVWFLMDKYKIPLENVIRHYDVTHKPCPRPFTGDDINEYYGVSGNEMWARFKQRVQNRSEVDEMDISKLTDEQVDQLIERISNRLSSKKISDYALTASKNVVAAGIFTDSNKDGHIDNPQGFVKRQDLAIVINKIIK